ncbi:MAG: hypothetical protein LT103_00110 [Burkholderiaceae bacterium]|nr:hypothetical protein [Burkholderiaceae bacterium]
MNYARRRRARIAAGLAVQAQSRAQRPTFAERYQLVTEETSMVLTLTRAEGEQALGLPRAIKIKQMLAAGWGGAGSVVDAASTMAAFEMPMAELDRPMVWKSGRSSPARDVLTSYEHRDAFALPDFLSAPRW